MANAFGNKSLQNSTYEAYKTVKKKEMHCNQEILINLANTVKKDERKEHLIQAASSYANPLMQYLYMRLAYRTWAR